MGAGFKVETESTELSFPWFPKRIFLLAFLEAYKMGTITDGPGNGGAAEKGSECLTG